MWTTVEEFEHWAEPAALYVVKYTGEHYKYIPLFFAFFATVFYPAMVFWGYFGQTDKKKRANLASCCMSIIHGIVTPLFSAWQIASHIPFRLDAPNNAAQDIIMQFSTAYMLADQLLFLVLYTPEDYLFILHHFVTIGYMLSSLHLRAGGLSCLILMFLGEVTSPIQNVWFIGKDLRGISKVANTVYEAISPPYTYIYLFVRSIAAPPIILWFAWRLSTLHPSILPAGTRIAWALAAVFATAGSQIWSMKLFKGLQRHLSKGEEVNVAAGQVAKKEL